MQPIKVKNVTFMGCSANNCKLKQKELIKRQARHVTFFSHYE